jgi:tetratricopeptide (TPR) repeat protein
VLNELGEVSLVLCRFDDAESYLYRALNIARDAPGKVPSSEPGVILNDIGKLLVAQGRYNEAEKAFNEALGIRLAVNGPLSANLAEPLGNLGGLYLQLGRFEEAEDCLRRALQARLDDPWHGPEHPYLFYSLEGLGRLYIRLRKFDQADSLLGWALRNVKRAYGPNHLHVAWCRLALGDLAMARHDPDRAQRLYRQAYGVAETILGADCPCLEQYRRPLQPPVALATNLDTISHYYE